MGFFSWAKEAAESLVSVALGSVRHTYQILSNWYGPNESFLGGTYSFLKRFFNGFGIVLGIPRLFYDRDFKRSRQIIAASATSFIGFYLGTLLFYEAVIKRVENYHDPEFAGSSLDSAADIAFYFLMIRTSAEMSVNCMFYNLALYKAVNDQANLKPPYPQGKDGLIDSTLAGLASTAYYLGNLLVAKTIIGSILEKYLGSSSIIVKLYLHIVDGYIYGASLAEYQMGGLSTKERAVLFANNKAAHFGIGFALLAMRYSLDYLVSLLAKGAKGYFVDEAIFNVVYQLFIVAAMTMPIPAAKPVPDEESGVDFLAPGRALMAGLLKHMGDKISKSVQPKTYELVSLSAPLQKNGLEKVTRTQEKGIFVLCDQKLFYVCNKEWNDLPITAVQLIEVNAKFKPVDNKTVTFTPQQLASFLKIIQFNPDKLWKHVIRDYFNHPFWKLLLWLFVPGSVRSQAIFDKTATRLFFEENLQAYLNVLDGIMQKRSSTLDSMAVTVVTHLPPLINPVNENERESYRFLFAPGLQPQLDSIKEDLKWIGQRIHREREKGTVTFHDKSWQAVLQAAAKGGEAEEVRELERLEPKTPVDVLNDVDENFIPDLVKGRQQAAAVSGQSLFAAPRTMDHAQAQAPSPVSPAQDNHDLGEYARYTVAVLRRGVKH